MEFQIGDLTEQYDWLDDDDPQKEIMRSRIQSKIYQKQYQEALQGQLDEVLKKMQTKQFLTVSDYLDECYTDGFVGTVFDQHGQGVPLIMPIDQEAMVRAVQLDSKISQGLYTRLGEDVGVLKKRITSEVTRSIATGASYAQVAKRLSNQTKIGFNRAVRIARTEGHRIQCTAAMDAMVAAKDKGADVLKQWDATLDDVTRESHRQVDGEIRELDKPFSNKLMFAGDPAGGAAEVINCRCALLQRARWALDEDELQTLKDRATYFGLDKSEEFDDFKKKYLKAVEEPVVVVQKPVFVPAKTRDEAYKLMTDVGFYEVGKGVQYIDDETIIEQANQLAALNQKFGAIGSSHTGYISAENTKKFAAATRGSFRSPEDQSIFFSLDSYGRGHAHIIAQTKREVASNWIMPAAETNYGVYTITHEYGHLLETKLIHAMVDFDDFDKRWRAAGTDLRASKKIRDAESTKHAKTIWGEIVAIAKENNPKFSLKANLSEYGRTTYHEAFAEAFANSQLGQPNELGRAMNIWLRRRGLVLE